MICPNCEAVVAEGVQFCPNCGNNFFPDNKRGNTKANKKTTRKINIRILFLTAAVVVIIVLVVIILGILSGNKGEKIAETLSDKLGRSIAMAEKNANVKLKTISAYPIMKSVIDYDYIVESDNAVRVEGLNLPKWAVLVEIDENEKIEKVIYYNFKVLEHSWKGDKTSAIIDEKKLEYGMNINEVNKLISFKPLSIIRTNEDITSYLYKYYFIDETTNNEKAYYLTVNYDVDNDVKSFTSKENKYMNYIFN